MSDLDNAVAAVTSQLIKDGLTGAAMTFAANAEAELDRLRRMADAYAHWCVAHIENTGRCEDCGGARANRKLHTASCDVAIHLGLEREAP